MTDWASKKQRLQEKIVRHQENIARAQQEIAVLTTRIADGDAAEPKAPSAS